VRWRRRAQKRPKCSRGNCDEIPSEGCGLRIYAGHELCRLGQRPSRRASDQISSRRLCKKLESSWDARVWRPIYGRCRLRGDTGRWLKGRDEIVKLHTDVLADLYKGSQFFVDATTIRFLRSDIAVVHSAWCVMYTKDGKELKRTTLAVLILAKAQGQWRIAAVHNTLTGGPGWSFADSKWIDRSVPTDSRAAEQSATH
jgi:uncharacterized protein (TIGR02246 family)